RELERDARTDPISVGVRQLEHETRIGDALHDARPPVVLGTEPELVLATRLRFALGAFGPPLLQTRGPAHRVEHAARVGRDREIVMDVGHKTLSARQRPAARDTGRGTAP